MLGSARQPDLSDHLGQIPHDARPAAVVRPRRPAWLGQGRRRRARGHRARRLRRGRRAAPGARRRALRPRGTRHRPDAGRPAARGAGERDPRPRRAGAPVRADSPGQRGGCRSSRPASSPSTSGRSSRRSARATRASRSRSRPCPGARSPTCSSTGAPTSRSAPPPGPSARRRSRRRRSCAAADHRRRAGHPLAGARAIAPAALDGERWLVGQPELDPMTATGLFYTRNGLAPADVATFRARRPRSPPPPPARGSCSRSPTRSWTRCAAAPWCVWTCAARRSPSCGTRARSGSAARCPPRWRCSASPRRSDATQAISAGRAGAVSARVRRRSHVTLWRSVADEIDETTGR